jgi:hypothetical protein
LSVERLDRAGLGKPADVPLAVLLEGLLDLQGDPFVPNVARVYCRAPISSNRVRLGRQLELSPLRE